jgi:SAM-dependent methyltransferase
MEHELTPFETKTADFWRSEGLLHIIPNTGVEFHEGYNPASVVAEWEQTGRILEVGCGYGRLVQAFSPARYVGVDINENAVLKARELNPGYDFRAVRDCDPLPETDTAFSYAVLLHICDEDLPHFLARMVASAKQIVIGEIMDTRWRRDGNPPVFNRDPEIYILEMLKLGCVLIEYAKLPYVRYSGPPYNVDRDNRNTFLRFVKL